MTIENEMTTSDTLEARKFAIVQATAVWSRNESLDRMEVARGIYEFLVAARKEDS